MNLNSREYLKDHLLGFQNRYSSHDSKIMQILIRHYLRAESKFKVTEKSYIRNLITRAFPSNPLSGDEMKYTLAVYCSPKDLAVLPYCLSAAIENLNIRESIILVAPENTRESIRDICIALEICERIKLVTDEELIEKYFKEIANVLHGASKMQMLKIASIYEIEDDYAMLLDSDTVIIEKRKWVTEQGICIQVSQEYMHRHQNFIKKNFSQLASEGLGFVTHHQMIPVSEIKSKLVPKHNLQSLGLEMQKAFDNKNDWESYYPSEWQIFGQFIRNGASLQSRIVQFGNLGKSQKNIRQSDSLTKSFIAQEANRLKKEFSSLSSVSFHSYK